MPVALLLAWPAALLAWLAAELAELWTLDRPSDALDDTSAAFSLAAPAACDVVEALRRPARRTANCDWRTTARDATKDMVMERRRGWAVDGGWLAARGAVVREVGWSLRHGPFFPDGLGEHGQRQQHHRSFIHHQSLTVGHSRIGFNLLRIWLSLHLHLHCLSMSSPFTARLSTPASSPLVLSEVVLSATC
jgi:hypothetical protein